MDFSQQTPIGQQQPQQQQPQGTAFLTQEQIEYMKKGYLPQKVAAQEVIKEVEKIKLIGIIATVGIFLSLIIYSFNKIVGSIVVVGFCVFCGFYVRNADQRIKYLKQRYQIY